MPDTTEVPIILGRPDYDWPLRDPVERDGGIVTVGRDALSYCWRFDGEHASLSTLDGRPLGTVRLGVALPDGVAERCGALSQAQARMRGVQTAYVQVCETLMSMVGEERRATMQSRLHETRERLGSELLMFTDPADDGAHGEMRLVPEVIGFDGPPRSADERVRLLPLARALLHQHLLGIDDPEALLALAV